MQDYVTFETAAKLKDAGFPQPEILFWGQVYYEALNVSRTKVFYNAVIVGSKYTAITDDDVFAPRCTDIMIHLPKEYELTTHISPGEYLRFWYLYEPESHVYGKSLFCCTYDENPAEAAAKMWLKLKEQ